MKPRLFVHIGTHKTGSTAIQRTLKAGEQACLREGLVRLDCDDFILRAKHEHGQADAAAWADSLRQQKARHSSGQQQRFLITSEALSGDPLTGYANAADMATRLRAATQEFEVTIIIFLRRQDDFIESLYTQKIHEGGFLTFQEFLQSIQPEAMNWLKLVESYAREFGRENLTVRRYHHADYPQPEDLIVDFCSIVGLPPSVLQGRLKTVRNQGFSTEAVELARLCNPRMDRASRKQLRQMLQTISVKPVFQSYNYLSLAERQQLLAVHEESNRQVLRDYLREPKRSSLFPAPETEPGSATQAGTGPADLTVTLVKMLLEKRQAEKRSGLLRFVMRLEQRWHDWRQSRAQRQSKQKVRPKIIPLAAATCPKESPCSL